MKSSGVIKEDSKVTLTCESDANPREKYIWYKENTTLPGKNPTYEFNHIRSKDSGKYHCQSSNDYGYLNSRPVDIDVQCKFIQYFHLIHGNSDKPVNYSFCIEDKAVL